MITYIYSIRYIQCNSLYYIVCNIPTSYFHYIIPLVQSSYLISFITTSTWFSPKLPLIPIFMNFNKKYYNFGRKIIFFKNPLIKDHQITPIDFMMDLHSKMAFHIMVTHYNLLSNTLSQDFGL